MTRAFRPTKCRRVGGAPGSGQPQQEVPSMTNENLGGNKPKPLTTSVSTGRRDDDRGITSQDHSRQKRPRSNASEPTGGRSAPASRPVELGGCKTRAADDPVLITDGGRDRECPECETLLVYRGKCAGCGWAADESELATDGGHERERHSQSPEDRLREAVKQIGIVREQIADVHGHPHEDDSALARAEILIRGLTHKLDEADRDHDPDPDLDDEGLIADGGIALERQHIVIPEDGTLTVAINGTKHQYDLDEGDDVVFEWEEGSQ